MAEIPNNAQKIFEAELISRGVDFKLLEDGRYDIEADLGSMKVSIDNIERQYARDREKEAIFRFIDTVLSVNSDLPEWSIASKQVFSLIEGVDLETGENTLLKALSDKTQLVAVIYDKQNGYLSFLTDDNVSDWAIAAEDVWKVAEQNLNETMTKTSVSFLDADGLTLGVIEAHEPLKASLIRSSNLRNKVEDTIGWPIYAVAPSRGFVYLIGKSDVDELGRVGGVVVKEFQSAEYPISTEIWEISENGIKTIGAFLTEE